MGKRKKNKSDPIDDLIKNSFKCYFRERRIFNEVRHKYYEQKFKGKNK